MNDPRLPTRSGRFENRQRPARSYTESQDCRVERDSYRGTGLSLISQTPNSTTHTYVSTHVMIVVDPSHRQCFWDQSSFSGDTNRSNHRWLPPPPQTSWTRPPLLSSLGSRTWRRVRPLNKLRTTSTNSSRLDDTCSSNSSALGSRTNAAYPLRSDPATSTPRSTCPRNRSNSGLRTGPNRMHRGTNNVFSRTSSLWTLQSSPTRRCNHAAIVNNRLCCSCYYQWNNTIWTCTIQTSTSSSATIVAPN